MDALCCAQVAGGGWREVGVLCYRVQLVLAEKFYQYAPLCTHVDLWISRRNLYEVTNCQPSLDVRESDDAIYVCSPRLWTTGAAHWIMPRGSQGTRANSSRPCLVSAVAPTTRNTADRLLSYRRHSEPCGCTAWDRWEADISFVASPSRRRRLVRVSRRRTRKSTQTKRNAALEDPTFPRRCSPFLPGTRTRRLIRIARMGGEEGSVSFSVYLRTALDPAIASRPACIDVPLRTLYEGSKAGSA